MKIQEIIHNEIKLLLKEAEQDKNQDIINEYLEECNAFLRQYGLSVTFNAKYNFHGYSSDWLAVYQNSSVKNNGCMRIGINMPLLQQSCIEHGTKFEDQIGLSIWHECGHGIVEWLKMLRRRDTQNKTNIFKGEMLEYFRYIISEEETVVEEFGAYQIDYSYSSSLIDFLDEYKEEIKQASTLQSLNKPYISRPLNESTELNSISVPDEVFFEGNSYYFDKKDIDCTAFSIHPKQGILYGDKDIRVHCEIELSNYLMSKGMQVPRNYWDNRLDWNPYIRDIEQRSEEYSFYRGSIIARGRIYHLKNYQGLPTDVVSFYSSWNWNHLEESDIIKILQNLKLDNRLNGFSVVVKMQSTVYYFDKYQKVDESYNPPSFNVIRMYDNDLDKQEVPFHILSRKLKEKADNVGIEYILWLEKDIKRYVQGFIPTFNELADALQSDLRQEVNICKIIEKEYNLQDLYLLKSIALNFVKQYVQK